MQKKQDSAKRQETTSFLTPDFLRRQKLSLEAKLSDCQNLQKSAREEIKVSFSDERKGDTTEQALTYSERQNAAQRLEERGKIILQVKRALDLINENLLAGEKSAKCYGICIGCEELIAERRLRAVPWALKCILCQEKEDAGENALTPD